ncbi:Rieske (2Fe-2S) protein [Candidatus Izemoplasma sp. B36]|uniref:Rieske (2Fe-2S) protein n=1 Tax=Candidatus Izemoplasma sp. B36 TaxID=3242468 RepID=UPI003556B8FE
MEYYVCEIETLKQKRKIRFKAKNRYILVAYTDNGIFAISDKCPHMGSSLFYGILSDGEIKCKDHGLPISVETGKVTNLNIAKALRLDEYSLDVRTFKTVIKDNKIYLDI